MRDPAAAVTAIESAEADDGAGNVIATEPRTAPELVVSPLTVMRSPTFSGSEPVGRVTVTRRLAVSYVAEAVAPSTVSLILYFPGAVTPLVLSETMSSVKLTANERAPTNAPMDAVAAENGEPATVVEVVAAVVVVEPTVVDVLVDEVLVDEVLDVEVLDVEDESATVLDVVLVEELVLDVELVDDVLLVLDVVLVDDVVLVLVEVDVGVVVVVVGTDVVDVPSGGTVVVEPQIACAPAEPDPTLMIPSSVQLMAATIMPRRRI
jgi:hypothetical protein